MNSESDMFKVGQHAIGLGKRRLYQLILSVRLVYRLQPTALRFYLLPGPVDARSTIHRQIFHASLCFNDVTIVGLG